MSFLYHAHVPFIVLFVLLTLGFAWKAWRDDR